MTYIIVVSIDHCGIDIITYHLIFGTISPDLKIIAFLGKTQKDRILLCLHHFVTYKHDLLNTFVIIFMHRFRRFVYLCLLLF